MSEPFPVQFGAYTLLRKLGHGGMAEIHLAVREGLPGIAQLVVVKRIRPRMVADPELTAMFLEEARIAATLTHSNICQIYEVGEVAGRHYLAMEYLDGVDLRSLCSGLAQSGRPLPAEHSLWIVQQAAAGLHYAHARTDLDGSPMNIVHRDVSPRNIFVTFGGAVKLLDFGIAKAESRKLKTAPGMLKGKLPYMSPEQVQGLALTRTSDVYALGIVLWELTVGQRLHQDRPDYEVIRRIVQEPIPAPSSLVPGYPPGLERIALKALAREPEERFETARDFRVALQAFGREHGMVSGDVELGELMRDVFADQMEAQQANRALGRATLRTLMQERSRTSGTTVAETPRGRGVESVATSTDAAVRAEPARPRRTRPWFWMVGLSAGSLVVALAAALLVLEPPGSGGDEESARKKDELAALEQREPDSGVSTAVPVAHEDGTDGFDAGRPATARPATAAVTAEVATAATSASSATAKGGDRRVKTVVKPGVGHGRPVPRAPDVIKSFFLRKHGEEIGMCMWHGFPSTRVSVKLDLEESGRVRTAKLHSRSIDSVRRKKLEACIYPIVRDAKLPPVESAGWVEFHFRRDALTAEELDLDRPALEPEKMADHFEAKHRAIADECLAKHPGTSSVRLKVTVNRGGRVTETKKWGYVGPGGPDAYECVAEKLKRVTFPKTRGGGTFFLDLRPKK